MYFKPARLNDQKNVQVRYLQEKQMTRASALGPLTYAPERSYLTYGDGVLYLD